MHCQSINLHHEGAKNTEIDPKELCFYSVILANAVDDPRESRHGEKAVPSVARRAKEGHSLAMLTRIAAAVEKRVEIRFVPKKRRLQRA